MSTAHCTGPCVKNVAKPLPPIPPPWTAPGVAAAAVEPGPPVMYGIVPINAPINQPPTQVTISGFNFTATTQVLFNGLATPTTFVSPTQLLITLPTETGPNIRAVTILDGLGQQIFTYY